MLTVYGAKNCQGCRATERKLSDLGIPYEKIDVEEQPEAIERIRALGYQGLPVVYLMAFEHWNGFQPLRIEALAEALK